MLKNNLFSGWRKIVKFESMWIDVWTYAIAWVIFGGAKEKRSDNSGRRGGGSVTSVIYRDSMVNQLPCPHSSSSNFLALEHICVVIVGAVQTWFSGHPLKTSKTLSSKAGYVNFYWCYVTPLVIVWKPHASLISAFHFLSALPLIVIACMYPHCLSGSMLCAPCFSSSEQVCDFILKSIPILWSSTVWFTPKCIFVPHQKQHLFTCTLLHTSATENSLLGVRQYSGVDGNIWAMMFHNSCKFYVCQCGCLTGI